VRAVAAGVVQTLRQTKGDGLLEHLLQTRREPILHKWLDLIYEAYPVDSHTFLKQVEDPFSNPVGHTFRQSTETLFDALCTGGDPDEVAAALDGIVRIRAVQSGTAAQATAFAFLLKNVIREEVRDRLADPAWRDALLEFESRIDGLALAAFEHYTACREQIYRIRTREAQKQSEGLARRAGKMDARDTAGNDDGPTDALRGNEPWLS
jgi:hypothetical protein